MRVVVGLPAYNEEGSLPPLLESLRAAFREMDHECRVLVVDDGSSDGTVRVANEYAQTMPVRVVSHGTNQGLGAAMRTCLREACRDLSARDVLVTMDADNTHPPALIPAMLRKLDEGCDLVIASRYAPGGDEVGLALHRQVLSRGASTLLRMCFRPAGARDCSCGYRAYRVGLLEKAFRIYGDKLVESAGFVCMAELLVKLAMLGARIGEAPLVLRYDLKGGASKMKVGRTVREYLGLVRQRRRFLALAKGQAE